MLEALEGRLSLSTADLLPLALVEPPEVSSAQVLDTADDSLTAAEDESAGSPTIAVSGYIRVKKLNS